VELRVVYNSGDDFYLCRLISDTIERMKARKEYNMIWDDNTEDTQLKLQSLFINLGTNILIRDNKYRSVNNLASTAAAFYITSSHGFNYSEAIHSSRHRVSLRNIEDGLSYESAKFFKRMTPCQCLKELYLRERSVPRMSFCSFCMSDKDRRELYLCSGCLYHHYCNADCQAGHWPRHKLHCKSFSPLVN